MILAMTLALAMQDAPADVQGQQISIDRHAVKALAKNLTAEGDEYEDLGRCAGAMTPGEVEGVLRAAQERPQAGPYLLGRYEHGFRNPRKTAWCDHRFSRDATTP